MIFYYDVYSDLSIAMRRKPTDLSKYHERSKTVEGQEITLYVHNYQKELHYVSCPEKIKAEYIR